MSDDQVVRVDTQDGYALITLPTDDEKVVEVPLGQVTLHEGKLWLQVPGPIAADIAVDGVTIQAIYPEPTAHHVAQLLSQVPTVFIDALMQEEFGLSGGDDTVGLIAQRACARAIVGDFAKPVDPNASLG